jgi:hypothetical protein
LDAAAFVAFTLSDRSWFVGLGFLRPSRSGPLAYCADPPGAKRPRHAALFA